MTNPYYAHSSGVPAALTRAASSQIRNEYDLIEDGFDLIDAAIDAKANIDSPTFTGTVTVPTPLTAAAAATKAYVDALSVAAGNVPTGGSTGQYLVKDSATDFDMSWGSIVSVGTGGTTSTSSITLTASSAAAMSVTPATPGLYVTLPDATTCTKADNLYSVYNAGDYDYGVKDSAGTQLGWIRARTGAMIGLADNATAAGVWAYYGLEKVGITASYVNSTLTNMGATLRRIALDANRTCFLFGGTDCYAIIYDASTQTWGSATLVRASVASGAFIGVLSATDQVLVCSCSGSNFEAVTLSIASNTITANTGTKAATTIAGSWASFGGLIPVGSSWVLSYGYGASANGIRALTVSGTTPTIGLQSTMTPAVNVAANLYASGSIVRTVSASASAIYAKPYTVSGSTLTVGTEANATTTAASFRAFLNGNGNIVAEYINTTHYATIFKLTGTVEVASSVSLGTAPTNITTHSDYVQVTAGKTAFTYDVGSTALYANILTDTAGTASAGTELTVGVVSGSALSVSAGLSASGNNARFATYSNNAVLQITFDCSGASPIFSSGCRTTYNAASAPPSSTDTYGVRPARRLTAGSVHRFMTAGNDIDQAYSANGIHMPTALQLASASGVVGAADNESVFAVPWNNNNLGFIINRVEAAA